MQKHVDKKNWLLPSVRVQKELRKRLEERAKQEKRKLTDVMRRQLEVANGL